MKLSAAFRLPELPRLALVGAGGKSSALFCLARELVKRHHTVILTTTTHLGEWQVKAGDAHLVLTDGQSLDRINEFPGGVVIATGPQHDERRYRGLDDSLLSQLLARGDAEQIPLLVEADGARLLPLKAPAGHEPAIPDFVHTVGVCAGLEGLGKPLSADWVHRPEIFAHLSGLAPGDTITPEALSRVLIHPQGGLKNIPSEARRVLLLTQADTAEKQAQANHLAQQVRQAFHGVIIAALPYLPEEGVDRREPCKQIPEIHAVHEPIAGVILAAGGAARYGSLKQLLDWQGQPLVQHAAQIALQAGLSPVVVMTGAGAEEVSQAVAGLPVRQVHNPDWQSGQSTSMQAGLRALPPTCGGVVFLLADQPKVTPVLVSALVEAHSRSLAPIVAPLVDGQRGNPVLFDPVTFGDLMQVTGDVGGRQLFQKYPIQYVPWHDRDVLLDVDEVEDYLHLVGGGG